ncbi:MAG: ABC transporter ATP-binding protein [Pyrinomonadaceae bacterium]|jgi:putative ABC transport system ATP-binding protein
MIEIKNLTKQVRSGSEVLTIIDDLSLSIPAGQFVALTGASGSGKSTLLGLIAGLDSATSGSIRIGKNEVTSMNDDDLSRLRSEKIGFIFQSFHLIPSLTALENIMIPLEIAGLPSPRVRALELLEDVGLNGRGHHFPGELSGGEQQRVAIARALANRPEILLADEPTGNLDSRNGKHVLDLMQEIHSRNKVTVVLVTHDAAISQMAERRISLSDGRIVIDEIL